jgi:hypothetical protein
MPSFAFTDRLLLEGSLFRIADAPRSGRRTTLR